ncbi:tRNA 2-selenouridine synthase [Campylobacter sp. CCUG 57310]|uniref:tRNA 2-selenouridine synthase n=1 Tax=Campylobacter sp. CCUG 57310 TaxID=2517362 RepID=UPI0015632C73|nr:tRNA 2-selenouridine synthase [Campylobacter sp. CCUG 57310]QKF91447.1 hypothetical protein CORI_0211 [Campylobacter sp. CCUG 57310]
MKFILAMLSIICLIFLTGCSAKDTNNINKKELEELANKYGGVYIFNKKYLEEIEKREEERKNMINELGDKIVISKKQIKVGDKPKNIYSINMKPIDEKLPQILSNGKRYYTSFYKYEGKEKVSDKTIEKIKNNMSKEAYEKSRIVPRYFYIENNELIPIVITVTFDYIKTNYGIFGDEGAGIRFKDKEIIYLDSDNTFYLE